MRLVLGTAALALASALAPGAMADHTGYDVVASTDFDAEHPPVAGVPVELNYYALDDGMITSHHNAIVALRSAGVALAELPFTHEHDSIFNALATPARAGPFEFGVKLPPLDHADGHEMSDDELLGQALVSAEARPLASETEAVLSLEGDLKAGAPSTLTFTLADEAGQPLTGYVLASVFAGTSEKDWPWHQVKLAAKEGKATTTFHAPISSVVVRALAWPSIFAGPLWAPVSLEPTTLEVAPQGLAEERLAPMVPPLPDPTMQAPGHEHAEGPHLYVSTDPAPMNWVLQTTRVNLIAMGADMKPLRHVDLAVRVTDELGRTWFESDSLHEVDGMAQLDFMFAFAGWHRVAATATPLGGEPLKAEHWFFVDQQGPHAQPAEVAVKAPEALAVGEPGGFTLGLHHLATGDSVPHSDYWLRVLHEGLEVLQTKVHTHQGDATAALAAPWPGEYEVRVSAYPQFGGYVPRATAVLALQAEGELPPLPLVPSSVAPEQPPRAAPGPEGVGALAAVGVALMLARRR